MTFLRIFNNKSDIIQTLNIGAPVLYATYSPFGRAVATVTRVEHGVKLWNTNDSTLPVHTFNREFSPNFHDHFSCLFELLKIFSDHYFGFLEFYLCEMFCWAKNSTWGTVTIRMVEEKYGRRTRVQTSRADQRPKLASLDGRKICTKGEIISVHFLWILFERWEIQIVHLKIYNRNYGIALECVLIILLFCHGFAAQNSSLRHNRKIKTNKDPFLFQF